MVELQTTNVNLSKEILVKLQDLDNEINGRGIFFRSRSRRRKAFKALRKLAHQTLDKVPEEGFNKLQVYICWKLMRIFVLAQFGDRH